MLFDSVIKFEYNVSFYLLAEVLDILINYPMANIFLLNLGALYLQIQVSQT